MKRWKRLTAWVFVLFVSGSLAIMSGCSDDPENGTVVSCTPGLETTKVISNPLTPAPGETVQLTVQSNGEGCGSWPQYIWEVEGGDLAQSNGISVQWVAPSTPGAVRVTCRASLSGAPPDTASALIMVRSFEAVDTGKMASLRPVLMNNAMYFVAESADISPRLPGFAGWHVYRREAGGSVFKVTDTGENFAGGYEFFFTESGGWIFGGFFTTYYSGLRQQRMNVWRFPTAIGSATNCSDDDGGPGVLRKDQHRSPYSNESGSMAVWKYQEVGAAQDGTQDLFNIAFWEQTEGPGGWYTLTESHDSSQVQLGSEVVWKHRYYTNIKPMFTPDESHIVYFVDTTGVYEPCLIPMVGTQPDLQERRALMVSDKVGIFEAAGAGISESTVFQWNESSGILAFVAGGRVFFFDYATESVASIDGLSGCSEVAWSPDGSQLAAIAEEGLFLISAAGTVNDTPLLPKERLTDEMVGVAWSSDPVEPRIGLRLVRKGKNELDSWSSLVMIDVLSGEWSYASPRIPWHSSRELPVDYTLMRVVFEADDTGMYAPFPVLDPENYPGKDVVIFHSYE